MARSGAPSTPTPGAVPNPRPKRWADRQQLITTLARDVTARRELADVLAMTLRGLRRLIRFGGGSIQLLDDDGWVRMAAADPPAAEEVMALRIPLDGTVAGRIILTEQPVYLPDITVDPGRPSKPENVYMSPGGVRSYYGVPLLADGRALGLLQIDAAEPAAWSDTDRLLVSCVAPIVAAAIQSARAHARVVAAEASKRRNNERWNAVARILANDFDAPLATLVQLSDSEPALRHEVDRLTAAVGCIRAITMGPAPGHDADAKPALDLRTEDKTRT